MSSEEREVYMKNVRWTTFWYAAFIIASLLTGGTFGVAAIRDDIKNTGNIEQRHYVATNHKIDSIQHDNSVSINDIWKEIINIENKSPKIRIIYKPTPAIHSGFVTEYKDPTTGKITLKNNP